MCKTRHVAVMLTSILFHQWTKWSCCVPNTPIVPSTSTYDIPNASTPLGAPARPPSGISLSLIFTMLSLPSGKFFSNMAAWASMLGHSWLWIHCGKECQMRATKPPPHRAFSHCCCGWSNLLPRARRAHSSSLWMRVGSCGSDADKSSPGSTHTRGDDCF